MTKFVLECRGSKEVVDDHTNHRGASMVFPVMNSIHTWKSPRAMRTTTHHVERFRGCHRIATTSRKGMVSKRYSVFSVNDNPELVDGQKRWEVSHQEEFIRGGAMPQYRRDTKGLILKGGIR